MTTYWVTYQTGTADRIDTAILSASSRLIAMEQARTLIANVANIVTIDEIG
jgi:hypothetical protein